MTPAKPAPEPSPFDCRRNRHCVLTADLICVLCGAKGVIDARRLPPLTDPEPVPHADLTPIATLEPPRSPQDPDAA